MSAARRSIKRRDWPRGLYEVRPGYYIWRHPTTGKNMTIGAVPFAVARNEALSANRIIMEQRPTLVDRLLGRDTTMADLLDMMPASANKNTAKANRSNDKKIRAALGDIPCGALTVKDCAKLIDAEIAAGNERGAQALRSRLVNVCRKGMAKGLMKSNPAEATERMKVLTKRGRLTLESFQAIYAKAGEVAAWLPCAMRWALVSGADRSTIAGMRRDMAKDGRIEYVRGKTGVRISVPLALRLHCVGWSLADLVAEQTGVQSDFFVHHQQPYGNAPVGAPVFEDRISKAFTAARVLAGIPDDKAPTFHEIRSLCKRLYEAQGGVDTKALLGHTTERMSALYANPRGAEAIMVRVDDSHAM